jgi:(S)-3,5-dihydroxyphenylglycine transaminase
MNFLNEVAMRYPDAISFAPGRPREEYFDVAASLEYVAAYAEHLARERSAGGADPYGALGQYGRTNGMIGNLIARMLRNDEHFAVTGADIVVTVGCQEAMCLALLSLCGNPGDVALIADPAYIGLSGAARVLGIELAPVASGADGIDLDALESTLARLLEDGKKPRLLYLSPDAANPTGATMPQHARTRLLALTRQRGIVVLEDHAYNYFQFDERKHAPLKSLPDSDHVVYLGSFSKSVYPGLRLGFLATTLQVRTAAGASTSLCDELSKIKSMMTVNTSPLCQAIAGGLLLRNDCSLQQFTAARRAQVQECRDAMLAALERHFPSSAAWCAGVRWNRPGGGFFLSLTLPFTVSEADLLCSAQDYAVLWTPMSYFYLGRDACDEIRLSFSYVTPAEVESGVAALARWVRHRVT